ncbi:EI24 domain-containing protein [Rubrivivax sp. RP6-9]|uniref:EI24 domain-containing protein n=1 Tax=Rubrivivax sp. RP6-9 TaxID=3415750 RepID=UPI003CC6B491
MTASMQQLFDSFWRAAAYCVHPRIILWSLLPLLLAGGACFAVGLAYWEAAVAAVRATLEQWSLVSALLHWLDTMGAQGLRTLVAPMIVVALSVPVVVLVSLLLVALVMTPAVVNLVASRRFPHLERKQGGTWWQGLAWSLACTVAAVAALVLSIPLWFVPPLVLVLPPLIWGWLTYRVYAFDMLADHASAAERRQLLREQRWPLLAMGVVCGYLGAVPSLIWAASAAALIFAPLLVLVSVWLYTLVFAFAACWFAHFTLAALQRQRHDALPPAPLPDTHEALPAL